MNPNRTRFGIGLAFAILGTMVSAAADQGALVATFVIIGVVCLGVIVKS